jgi:putative transposase
MARIARAVAPGLPHHVTQRGNRRQQTFFNEEDYQSYLELMAEWCGAKQVDIWAYCLMPNHIHLIAIPREKESLTLAIGEAHRRYTRRINFREGWRGHLWQGRFSSFILDENHLLVCTKYIEMNPVRSGLVERVRDWPWSSARAHLKGRDDLLVRVKQLLEMTEKSWNKFLGEYPEEPEIEILKKHERTGRPLGSESFVKEVEALLGRLLQPQKAGRKKLK